MAFVRLTLGDQSSAEFDQLRRTVNALLLMLETSEANLTAGASAADILNAWADAVRTGLDSNPASIANITPTNVEVVGLRPMNRHPGRPGFAVGEQLKSMTSDDASK
jgi:hypothetical protein